MNDITQEEIEKQAALENLNATIGSTNIVDYLPTDLLPTNNFVAPNNKEALAIVSEFSVEQLEYINKISQNSDFSVSELEVFARGGYSLAQIAYNLQIA